MMFAGISRAMILQNRHFSVEPGMTPPPVCFQEGSESLPPLSSFLSPEEDGDAGNGGEVVEDRYPLPAGAAGNLPYRFALIESDLQGQ